MDERHENEQYFFDALTTTHLAAFLSRYRNPCCLCAPRVGRELVEQGTCATILDIDERFAQLPGYRHYDLSRPVWIKDTFDLILCDPPFFNISLTRLLAAIRLLSHYDDQQPLLICYLKRREKNLVRTFERFNLKPTGYFPSYETVQSGPKNEIEFFSNVPEEKLDTLLSPSPQ